ncbi:metalloprotease [Paraphoma chrysanthemicola]|nr:metalloprotease [Paraphoma chrysanthemicola]
MVAASVWVYFFASTAGALASICGTHAEQASLVSSRTERRQLYPGPHSRRANNTSVPLNVDVYMHVISPDGTKEEGHIDDATISAQIDVLNNAFQPVGFEFKLVETTPTVNEYWYYNLREGRPVESEVGLALRKGDFGALNVYTMGTVNTTESAWATLPASHAGYDGVFQNNTVFLGGSSPIYTAGITLVHEVGHWFGLYHPLNFGCAVSYDYVADTPNQQAPLAQGGCPIGLDSCPDQPGLDSIHNYMSYTDDQCRNEFTPGQIQRMREQVALHRGLIYPGIDVNNIPEDRVDIPPPEDT